MSFDRRWDNKFSSQNWGRYPNEQVVRFICRYLLTDSKQTVKNKTILDLGCGAASNLWFLAKEGLSAVGIDASKHAIAQAQRVLTDFDVSAELLVGEINKLPFASNIFDSVLDVSAIQHNRLEQVVETYSEIKRVLKENGLFFSICIGAETQIESITKALEPGTYDSATPFSTGVLTHYFTENELLELWGDVGPITIGKIDHREGSNENLLSHFVVVGIKKN